jgi:ABC-type glycerol-3-phosphate transport system permease component
VLLPSHLSFSTFGDAWTDGHMGKYLRNSFVVTIAIVMGQVATVDPRRLRLCLPPFQR